DYCGGVQDDSLGGAERDELGGKHSPYGWLAIGGGPLHDQTAGGVLARQSLQVQRVAAGGEVHAVPGRAAQLGRHQLGGLVERQGTELGNGSVSTVGGGIQRGGQPGVHLSRAVGHGECQLAAGRMPQQVLTQFNRAAVGPVHVLEDEHDTARQTNDLKQ